MVVEEVEEEEEASEVAVVAEDMVVVVEDMMVRGSSTWSLLFEQIHAKSLKEYSDFNGINVEKERN